MSSYTLSSWFEQAPRFDPDDDRLDIDFVERFAPYVDALSLYFRPTYHGLENIPREGAALVVGNHGVLGFDGFLLFIAIYRATGRLVRGLGDHHLFVLPGIRHFWQKIGAVPGTQENAIKLLGSGNLVNTYPGGARDALKEQDRLYRLHWENAFGFIEVAMRAQVPIILHMGIGIDESYRRLGRIRWTGRLMGHPKYEIPLFFGWGLLPRPVKFTYYISEPIELEGGAEGADDLELVRHNHARVWRLAQKMLDDGVRRRRSVWFG